ncbi:MAG: PEGA domain-containing protein [Proteobacteria bacterium]|nr:PEGA domain-containing protein [Pseudomonadota bacterium]MCP4916718.1 PEGA domain-containing protein [Pseudomonadota bacterium]
MLHVLLAMFMWVVGVAHAEEDPGILRITSNVAGAQVWVDNESVGETPVTRYLPAGSHSVRIAQDGYNPFVQRVTLFPGKATDVNATLQSGGSTVDFVITPGGGEIILDGQPTNRKTPTRLTGVPAGNHEWRVERDGHEPLEGTFTLAKGGNALVFGEMLSSEGRFSITSRPEGATIYLDGEMVGVTPLELEDIPPGEHRVGIVHPDHALLVRTVETWNGEKGEVSAKLKDEGAKLIVKTGSASATVTLDGVPIGTGKKVKTRAQRGGYELHVEAIGAASADEKISVPISGAVQYDADLAAVGGTSSLTESTPTLRRPIFWIAVGGGAALVGGGAAVTAAVLAPDPDPEGDTVLQLP